MLLYKIFGLIKNTDILKKDIRDKLDLIPFYGFYAPGFYYKNSQIDPKQKFAILRNPHIRRKKLIKLQIFKRNKVSSEYYRYFSHLKGVVMINSNYIQGKSKGITPEEKMDKIEATPSEKIALLNQYKSIIETYNLPNMINIYGDYENMLAVSSSVKSKTM